MRPQVPKLVDDSKVLSIGGGSNSIFVCRFCEHFAKRRGWTDINVLESAHKILRIIAITRPFSQYRPREELPNALTITRHPKELIDDTLTMLKKAKFMNKKPPFNKPQSPNRR